MMSWEHWTISATLCFGMGLVAGMALSTTQMGLQLGEGILERSHKASPVGDNHGGNIA